MWHNFDVYPIKTGNKIKGCVMKNTIRILVIIALVAIIGFSFVSCGGDDDSGGDEYKLTWGLWMGVDYSYISSQFIANGANPVSAGSSAGYITGNDASRAFSIASTYPFDDDGTMTGSFETLLNFKKDGIGAPQELKSAMLAQKDNVPVGGIFQASINGSVGVIGFYVEKIIPMASGFTVNETTGSLTMNGFPSDYNGAYIFCTWYNGNEGLEAYDNINRDSASSITITRGTVTDGSVTLKVWKVIQEGAVYNNFTDSGEYSVLLSRTHDKTLNVKWGEAYGYSVQATIKVKFINGQSTVDVSSYIGGGA